MDRVVAIQCLVMFFPRDILRCINILSIYAL